MRRLYPYRRAIALTKAARRRSAAIYRRLGAERLSFPEAFDEERQRNSFCDRLSVVVKAVGFGKGWWTPGDGLVCSKGNVLRTTRAPQLLSSSTPQPLSSSTPQPLSPSAPQLLRFWFLVIIDSANPERKIATLLRESYRMWRCSQPYCTMHE